MYIERSSHVTNKDLYNKITNKGTVVEGETEIFLEGTTDLLRHKSVNMC